MDRDEAIARGLRVHETQHSMKRRSPWHDYHGRGTYMLTLVVEGRMPLLGKLWGRVDARPGDGDAPKVMLSELGIAIAKEEIPKIHKYYPQVEVWRVCIMPDHIHLIVRVKEDLRGGQAMESLGTEARGGQASALAKGANQALAGENEAGSIGMTAKREKEMGSLGIPALAPYSNDDKIAMLIRAHYTRIPLDKYRQLLTAFVIRDRLRMRLGLPTNSFAPTPSLTSQKEDYLIDKIIKYSQTLVRREDVEVLQRFIYHEISYLPPEYKLRVDNMTERFLSEEAREGIQINAIKEQTKALKEVAKKPTIQAEHYHAGDSTFDVHSKHLHLDHQEEGNSALLPSEL